MTVIKLCGLMSLEDIDTVNTLAPEMAGFVFAPLSKRALSHAQAAEMKARLDPGIQAVGVFRGNTLEEILALVDAKTIDAVQLHGDFPAESELVRALAARQIPYIRAVNLTGKETAEALFRLTADADMVLLDAAEPGSGVPAALAGTALPRTGKPLILAGGLTPGNVAGMIARYAPDGVDVSSGIESGGRKDPQKMQDFVRCVRQQSLQTR